MKLAVFHFQQEPAPKEVRESPTFCWIPHAVEPFNSALIHPAKCQTSLSMSTGPYLFALVQG